MRSGVSPAGTAVLAVSPSQHPVSPSLLTGARVRSRKGLSIVHSLLSCGSNSGVSPTLFWSQTQNRAPSKVNLMPSQTNPHALCTGALMRHQPQAQHQPRDAPAGLVTFCPITCPQLHGEAGNRADTRAGTAWICLMLGQLGINTFPSFSSRPPPWELTKQSGSLMRCRSAARLECAQEAESTGRKRG